MEDRRHEAEEERSRDEGSAVSALSILIIPLIALIGLAIYIFFLTQNMSTFYTRGVRIGFIVGFSLMWGGAALGTLGYAGLKLLNK